MFSDKYVYRAEELLENYSLEEIIEMYLIDELEVVALLISVGLIPEEE